MISHGCPDCNCLASLHLNGNILYCVDMPYQSRAHAGSNSALVQRHTAGAISALVHHQALLSVQGSQAKPHISLSACCQTVGGSPDGSMGSPWDPEVAMKQMEAMPSPITSGLELVPDLASLGALAEQLIFQSGVQEEVQV